MSAFIRFAEKEGAITQGRSHLGRVSVCLKSAEYYTVSIKNPWMIPENGEKCTRFIKNPNSD